jgi:hypothetical protein
LVELVDVSRDCAPGSPHATVLARAVRALGELARAPCPESAVRLVQEGAARALVALCGAPRLEGPVLAMCVSTLAALLERETSRAAACAEAACPALMVQLLEAHCAAEDSSCGGALGGGGDSSDEEGGGRGKASAAVHVLRSAARGVRAIAAGVASDMDARAGEALVAAGATPALLRLCREGRDASALERATAALASLAMTADCRAQLVQLGVGPVVRLLRPQLRQPHAVREQACKALASLALFEDARLPLFSSGAVPALVQVGG